MKCRRKGIQRWFLGLSDFLALQSRVSSTLPVEFLELQAWWAADSPWIPMAVLTGSMSSRLIHWRALIKPRVVWGFLWFQLTGQSSSCGHLVFGLDSSPPPRHCRNMLLGWRLWQLIYSCLSPTETLWFQLPPEHCLHCGERVLRALLLLWHARYVACVWGVTFPSWGLYTTGLIFLSCAVCSARYFSKLIDTLECVYKQCTLTCCCIYDEKLGLEGSKCTFQSKFLKLLYNSLYQTWFSTVWCLS